MTAFVDYIQHETLAVELVFESLQGVEPLEFKIAGHAARLYVVVAT